MHVTVCHVRVRQDPAGVVISLPPQNPVEFDAYGEELQRRLDPAEFDAFRAYLPTRGFQVYELADGDGRPLYIGQTRRPRLRLREHWRTWSWWAEVATIALTAVPDELTARRVELRLHEQLRPEHSQIGPVELHLIAALAGVAQ